MKNRIYSSCFFIGLLILLAACKQISGKQHPDAVMRILDPIGNTPEWLKTNAEAVLPSDSLNIWIPTGHLSTSSLIRVPRFPTSKRDDDPEPSPFDIHLAAPSEIHQIAGVRNEQQSFQVAIASKSPLTNLSVKIDNLISDKGDTLHKKNIKVRYVRYVPVQRARSELIWSPRYEDIYDKGVSGFGSPDIVADPLMELTEVDVPAYRTQPVWLTLQIPASLAPGTYSGSLHICTDQHDDVPLKIAVNVLPPVLPSAEDYKFFLDLWFNPNAVAVANDLELWSEEHWKHIEPYLEDLASRGAKTVTTTIVPYPWKVDWIAGTKRSQTYAGYPTMVNWYRDHNDRWSFDYSVFDRFVETCFRHGIDRRIDVFSLTPFDHKGGWKVCFTHTGTNDPDTLFFSGPTHEYKEIWKIFLHDFENHLSRKGWLNKTYLSFDESPREIMDSILDIVSGSAPGFLKRFSVAGKPDTEELAGSLSVFYTFLPDSLQEGGHTSSLLEKRRNDPQKTTTYYLCGDPSHPNSFTYSPATEIRMLPWLSAYYKLDGYLRWAYNSWSDKDPYNNPVFNFIQGDDYYIYPGKYGPVSSIRWELLKEGIEDYELLRVLDSPHTSEAIRSVVKNRDGRTKNVADFEHARNLVLNSNQ